MTREIKFRVWCDWAKKMLIVGNIAWNSKGEIVRVQAGETNDWLKDGWFDIDKANIHLMQYTGLKDSEGKEIYEGDIVNKRYHNLHLYDGVGAVEMANGDDSDGWAHGEWYGWMAGGSSLLDVSAKCEVIGNIWEHPELWEITYEGTNVDDVLALKQEYAQPEEQK